MAAGEPALPDHPDRAACEGELRAVSSLPRKLDMYFQSVARTFLKSLPEGEDRAIQVLSVGSVTPYDDEGLAAALAEADRRITYVLASDSPHLGDARDAERIITANDPNASAVVHPLAYFTEKAEPASAALVVFHRGIAAVADASTAVRRALEVAGDRGHVISVEQAPFGLSSLRHRLWSTAGGGGAAASRADTLRRALYQLSASFHEEAVEGYVDVSECLRNSAAGGRILSALLHCDFAALQKSHPVAAAHAVSTLQDLACASARDPTPYAYHPAHVFVVGPSAAGAAPHARTSGAGAASVVLGADASAAGADLSAVPADSASEWWPEGPRGRFVNAGLARWNARRVQWRTTTRPRPPLPPALDYDELFDNLSELRREYTLPGPIRLPELVDLYQDVWDAQQLY